MGVHRIFPYRHMGAVENQQRPCVNMADALFRARVNLWINSKITATPRKKNVCFIGIQNVDVAGGHRGPPGQQRNLKAVLVVIINNHPFDGVWNSLPSLVIRIVNGTCGNGRSILLSPKRLFQNACNRWCCKLIRAADAPTYHAGIPEC